MKFASVASLHLSFYSTSLSFTVQISRKRVNRYLVSVILYNSKLWEQPPIVCFLCPMTYMLWRGEVSRYPANCYGSCFGLALWTPFLIY